MSSIIDSVREISSLADRVLGDIDDNLPNIDKSDLESRLTELEDQARNLAEAPMTVLPDAIESLADAIHELYTEV